jgi:hypothetical protein
LGRSRPGGVNVEEVQAAMLRIQRTANGQVVFTLIGRMDQDNTAEVEALISSEAKGRPIGLDLRDVTIVNQDAIDFLERCEANGIALKNCPAYIREWISGQRRESYGLSKALVGEHRKHIGRTKGQKNDRTKKLGK